MAKKMLSEIFSGQSCLYWCAVWHCLSQLSKQKSIAGWWPFNSNQNRHVICALDVKTCSERNINGGCLSRRGEKNNKKKLDAWCVNWDRSQIQRIFSTHGVVKEKSRQIPTVYAVLEFGGFHRLNIKKVNHKDFNIDWIFISASKKFQSKTNWHL